MKRYFLAHIAPKDKILEYKLSFAACNFSYNLIEGKCFDKVFSILPSYVLGKKKLPTDTAVDYVYSSWRWKNKLFQRLAPLKENIMIFKKIEKNTSIWLYNMTILNFFLVLLLRWFKSSVKINIIVLDFTPNKGFNNFFLYLINKCDGRILLANSPLFNKINSVLIPGVAPIKESKEYPLLSEIKMDFLLSGVLSENIAMLSMVLSAFSKMPHLTLHITGISVDDTLIKKYTVQCPNIIYYGSLPYEKYVALLSRISFQLSTRNPKYPENQCNFPSKIIEALIYNRIVISTLHYEQLNGVNYLEVPSNEEAFIKSLSEIAKQPKDVLRRYSNQSRITRLKYSTDVWNKTMKKIENTNA